MVGTVSRAASASARHRRQAQGVRLLDVVDASRRVAATRARLEKVAASLLVADVDRCLTSIRDTTGAGSSAGRRRVLAGLLARATEPERDFLVRLALGELRQGALEGLVLDAIARAAAVPPDLVRRAHTSAGDLGEVASAALGGGMTDAMLASQTGRLLALELGRDGHVVHVRPELVVEVAFDGLQTSPRDPSGLALRFARVKRWRDDERAAEADTIDTVRALYARQGAPGG
jgi:ATP-dependent DNA ligase